MFNVITACYRYKNLPIILQSIKKSNILNLPIDWFVVLHSKQIDLSSDEVVRVIEGLNSSGNIKIHLLTYDGYDAIVNTALLQIKDGLVCVIDDDNIMHPDFISQIAHLSYMKKEVGILYAQNMGRPKNSCNPRIRVIDPNRVEPQRVDTAQFTISRSLIGDLRWPSAEGVIGPYCPDGYFISTLYHRYRSSFLVTGDVLCYYNYLSSPDLDFS